jgi:hypothetical protein
MTDSRTNRSPCGGSAKRADAGAFFTRGNFAAGTAGPKNRCRN